MTCKYEDCRNPATIHLCRECAIAEADATRNSFAKEVISARRSGRAEGLREAAQILRDAADVDARNAVHCSAPNHRERLQNLAENELVMAQRMMSRSEEVERE